MRCHVVFRRDLWVFINLLGFVRFLFGFQLLLIFWFAALSLVGYGLVVGTNASLECLLNVPNVVNKVVVNFHFSGRAMLNPADFVKVHSIGLFAFRLARFEPPGCIQRHFGKACRKTVCKRHTNLNYYNSGLFGT